MFDYERKKEISREEGYQERDEPFKNTGEGDRLHKEIHRIVFPEVKTNYIKCSDLDTCTLKNTNEVDIKTIKEQGSCAISWEQLQSLFDYQ